MRDQRSPDQGTENDEDKSRAEIRFSSYLILPKMHRLEPTVERIPPTGETRVVRTMKLEGIFRRRHEETRDLRESAGGVCPVSRNH